LLRGSVEVTGITLVEPQLRLAWHGDGQPAVEIGQSGGPAAEATGLPEALIGWLSSDDPAAPLPSLRHVRVVRA
jgi:hypothetical protein